MKKIRLIFSSIIIVMICLGALDASAYSQRLDIAPFGYKVKAFEPIVLAMPNEQQVVFAQTATKKLKVHFVDVGQGDSILIQSPNGQTMLVDGGPKSASTKLVAYLKKVGIKKLDVVVATHPDADHIGGLIAVVKQFKIGQFVNSGKLHTTETYEELLRLIFNGNIKYMEPKEGSSIAFDKALKLQVLHVNPVAEDINDAAIVLKVTYNKISFLLTSDIDSAIESKMASTYNVSATILKAGHHGSDSSNSLAFLKKVKPKATILSYGQGNSYGHPHATVVKNLKAIDSTLYSTAESGTVIVTTDGKTYAINVKAYTGKGGIVPSTQTKPSQVFKNCTELRKVYPNGVSSKHPAYQAKMDRDKDNWACEQ